MNSGPGKAIGRPQKVAREEMIGMATALRVYVDADEDALLAGLRAKADYVAEELRGVRDVDVSVMYDQHRFFVPNCVIGFPPDAPAGSAAKLASALHEGDPGIYVASAADSINVNPLNLQDGEERIVARRVREELERA